MILGIWTLGINGLHLWRPWLPHWKLPVCCCCGEQRHNRSVIGFWSSSQSSWVVLDWHQIAAGRRLLVTRSSHFLGRTSEIMSWDHERVGTGDMLSIAICLLVFTRTLVCSLPEWPQQMYSVYFRFANRVKLQSDMGSSVGAARPRGDLGVEKLTHRLGTVAIVLVLRMTYYLLLTRPSSVATKAFRIRSCDHYNALRVQWPVQCGVVTRCRVTAGLCPTVPGIVSVFSPILSTVWWMCRVVVFVFTSRQPGLSHELQILIGVLKFIAGQGTLRGCVARTVHYSATRHLTPRLRFVGMLVGW